MTRPEALCALVQSLVHPDSVDPEGYRTPRDLNGDGIDVILREISLSLLTAHISFRNMDGQTLRILASNRRLCSVIEIPQDLGVSLNWPLGATLDAHPEAASVIMAAFLEFCEGSDEISVRTEIQSGENLDVGRGITVCVLEDHKASISKPSTRDQTAQIADFLAQVMDSAGDWIMVEGGDVVGHSGVQPKPYLWESIAAL